MALSIVCPGCDADYSVPETLLGKAIRCKKCGETIDVKARPKAKAVARRGDDDENDRPRKAVPRRRDEESEDDYTPKKKGVSPLLIGGLAALLIGGGAAGAYFAFAGEKAPEPAPMAKRDVAPPVNEGATETPKDEPKKVEPVKEEPKKEEPKKDVAKALDTKPIPPEEKKPDEKRPDLKKPDEKPSPIANPAQPPAASSQGQGSGLLSQRDYIDCNMPLLIQEQVAKSTVLFKVDQGEGSGWFAIEPGLVITNAHVLHMLGRNPKPPKKIEIVLNSGTVDERVIPHTSIKIMAVDGIIDLALLQISSVEKDLPPPLKVKRSNELQLSQRLRVFGFPLGSNTSEEAGGRSKNPAMSIRPTTVTALRRDDFGTLRTVQHEGGVTNGNSGGPIVDGEGHVAAVVVRGYVNEMRNEIEQTQASAIATEWVIGLMAGRIDEVLYGDPIRSGERIKIPVKVKMLDPLKRVTKVGIRFWVGTSTQKTRAPGVTPAPTIEGDREHKEISLKYDPETKMASGFLDCEKITADKTVYWSQPFISTGIAPLSYEVANPIPHDNIVVVEEDALLVAKSKEGSVRTLTLSNSTTRGLLRQGQSERRNNFRRVDEITMKETTVKGDAQDPQSAARLRLQYEKFILKVALGVSEIDIETNLADQINNFIKKVEAYAWVNRTGEVYKTKTNALGLTGLSQQGVAAILDISDSCLESLRHGSISLPNENVKAGHTWKVQKDQTVTVIERVAAHNPPVPEDLKYTPVHYVINTTYKYVGTREREGRKEAVIEVEGVVNAAKGKSADLGKGTIRGRAIIELNTGVVLDYSGDLEYELDFSGKGQKRTIVGHEVFKLKRGSAN